MQEHRSLKSSQVLARASGLHHRGGNGHNLEYIMVGGQLCEGKRGSKRGRVLHRPVSVMQEHRSLKSSQVLVRASDLTAKVADSGLQAITRHCLRPRSFRFEGTIEWGAPEVLMGQM